MSIFENLLSKADLLIMFVGFVALLWKAMNALQSANSENSELTKIMAKLMAGTPAPDQVPAPSIIPPKVSPAPTPASPAQPAVPSTDDVIDQGLVDFIKKEEGFRAKAYWDYKQWSIGYGTKAKSADEVIDQAEAETRLRAEIAIADKLVTDFAPGLPKGAHQALLDLTYNAGSGWEQGSLGRAVKAQKWDTVKADILEYNHAGGQVNEGLTKRRQAEVQWFDNPL